MKRAIVFAVALATAPFVTPSGGTVRADAPPAGSIGGCPAGSAALALLRVESLSDGGTIDWYSGNGDPGVPVPPASFDPLSASADELAEYGLPPRPTDPASLASWSAEMSRWNRSDDAGLCQLSQPVGSDALVSTTSAAPQWAHAGLNWSGYVAKQTTITYIAVQGDYYQAAYHVTSCPNPLLWGTWTGLGGYWGDSGGIIQTGTAVSTSAGGSVSYYAWTEVYPFPPKTWAQVLVHPGDHLHTYVVYQRSTGKTTMYVADDTTSTFKSEIETQPSQYYDGRTAEAIDERTPRPEGPVT